MSQSLRYLISTVFLDALKTAFPAAPGLKVERNPPNPFTSRDGPRIVFLTDESDALKEQPGQQAVRRFAFSLGVINRGSNADADADADYATAAAAITAAFPAAAAALESLGASATSPRESGITFTVEGIDVGGALNLGSWDIEYRKPKPARSATP